MSRDNVEVVQRIYAAWNAGDPGLAYMHPSFELRQYANLFDTAGLFHGHDGVLESARELLGQLVVPISIEATGRVSKIPVEESAVHVWAIRDELATRLTAYEDMDDALEAVELRE